MLKKVGGLQGRLIVLCRGDVVSIAPLLRNVAQGSGVRVTT